jgi:hypothetical protein
VLVIPVIALLSVALTLCIGAVVLRPPSGLNIARGTPPGSKRSGGASDLSLETKRPRLQAWQPSGDVKLISHPLQSARRSCLNPTNLEPAK